MGMGSNLVCLMQDSVGDSRKRLGRNAGVTTGATSRQADTLG